jgi:hypothetical protein
VDVVVFGWAVGAADVVMPGEDGIPVGIIPRAFLWIGEDLVGCLN